MAHDSIISLPPHLVFAAQVGQAIRAARCQHGLTQHDLAELINVSDRTLRNVEQGDPGTSFGTVILAAQAVGVRWEVRQ